MEIINKINIRDINIPYKFINGKIIDSKLIDYICYLRAIDEDYNTNMLIKRFNYNRDKRYIYKNYNETEILYTYRFTKMQYNTVKDLDNTDYHAIRVKLKEYIHKETGDVK